MENGGKKQIPLRISETVYGELVRLSEIDFRSINGEIEFILTEYVRKRKFGSSNSEKDTTNK